MVAMLAAGFGSGWVAYQLGIASLKGVSQPDINPAKKFTNDRTSYGRNQTFIKDSRDANIQWGEGRGLTLTSLWCH